MISDPHELYRFLATPGFEVVDLLFAIDSVVWSSWRHTADEQVPILRQTNEVIGASVACGCRMHFYAHQIISESELTTVIQTALYSFRRTVNRLWYNAVSLWEA